MPRLLVVHHTPSPATRELLEAVLAGARHPDLQDVEVVVRPALGGTVVDVLEADGYLLGTTANFGYMSGALKHFFDTVYYPCLDATSGRPYGVWVHGNDDVSGAVRAIRSIAGGLRWNQVSRPVEVTGPVDAGTREACRDLGATVAATLLP
ncbi:MAG TPA: flavodoxin family protein [Kineosporiaceae bacterium]